MQVMMPRTHDVDYHVDHWHGSLFMVKRTHDTPNSELVIAPLADPTQQHVLLEHRRDVKLEDVAVSERHLAVLERSAKVGLQECRVHKLPASKAASDVRAALPAPLITARR